MYDYLEAIFKLGLPMLILSWWVYSSLYRNSHLDKAQSLKESEKLVSKLRKKEKSKQAEDTQKNDYWTNKWIKFGGGFYGLATLWTLIVIEAQELWQFLSSLDGFIANYSGSFFGFLLGALTNQLQNIGKAFAWVVYWTGSFSLIWFVTAYIAYQVGYQLAQRKDIKQSR